MSEHYGNFPYYMPPVFSVFLMVYIYQYLGEYNSQHKLIDKTTKNNFCGKHVIEKESNCVVRRTRGHHVDKLNNSRDKHCRNFLESIWVGHFFLSDMRIAIDHNERSF